MSSQWCQHCLKVVTYTLSFQTIQPFLQRGWQGTLYACIGLVTKCTCMRAQTCTNSAALSIRELTERPCTRTRLVRLVKGDAFAECSCSAVTERRRTAQNMLVFRIFGFWLQYCSPLLKGLYSHCTVAMKLLLTCSFYSATILCMSSKSNCYE